MGLNAKALMNYKPGNSGGGANDWFKPRPGDDGSENRYSVRLILKPGDDLPFFDTILHYFRTKDEFSSGACPRAFGEFCPACDMFFVLNKAFKDDKRKKEAQILRNIAPTTRIYTNVVVRGVDRVQVWGMPFGLATNMRNALMTYIEDDVDLTDPEKGHDLVFSCSKKGAVQQYSDVTVRPKPSKLDIEDWEAQVHDLEEKAHNRTFDADDVMEQVEKVLGDDYASFKEMYELLATERKATKKETKEGIGEEV
jgi:hypothetical protein